MEEENHPQTLQDTINETTKTVGTGTPENPIHKIPVIRTYEHDIAEMMAQKKISSASISIAGADARRKEASTLGTIASADQAAPISSAPPIPSLPQATFAQGNQKIIPPLEQGGIPVPTIVPPQPEKPEKPHPNVRPRSISNSSHRHGNGIIKSLFKIIISLILIALGIWGGYYLYTISPFGRESASVTENPAIVTSNTTPIIPSIITPDTQKIVDISENNSQEILSKLSATQKENSTGILGLVLKETYVSSTTPTTLQVTAPEFMAKIGMNPPDAFITSLNNVWMIGFNDTTPFMILTTNFFQNTFAGMLAWEPTMPEDMSTLFGFPVNISGKYEDRILDNKNIREFVNASGTPVFLYGFIDNQTLIISGNETTFSKIVNRIEKQTYVR
jgi:hypothetical protein